MTDKCPNCGREKHVNATLCADCQQAEYWENYWKHSNVPVEQIGQYRLRSAIVARKLLVLILVIVILMAACVWGYILVAEIRY